MAVSDAIAAHVLAKCARRCCICRRFDPRHLQVHHITPISEGGADEEDNLIAVCLTCHCDVHTRAPFARRFTAQELKGHRDAVYALAAAGRLPCEVPGAVRDAADAVRELGSVQTEQVKLSALQIRILIDSGTGSGQKQGRVEIVVSSIEMGDTKINLQGRESALYRHAFEGLCRLGAFDSTDDHRVFYLNENGYRIVDQLLALGDARARTESATTDR